MADEKKILTLGSLRLLHFDVVSQSPISDDLRISGARLIAPSKAEAVLYMRDALKATGRLVPTGELPGYDLIPAGVSFFSGTKAQWIQAQLRLKLSRDEKAVQLPAEDDLEAELAGISAKEALSSISVLEEASWEPGLYDSPTRPGPAAVGLLGLGVVLLAGPMFAVFFPGVLPQPNGSELSTGLSVIVRTLTGPMALTLGTIAASLGAFMILVGRD